MTNTANEPYQMLAAVFDRINTGVNGSCLDASYKSMIQSLSNITIDVQMAGRQWTYQTCREFGYFQSCEPQTNCMFSPLETVTYYTNMCNTLFAMNAADVTNNILATNAYYGGTNPVGASNIVFVNGLIDPWHALSITQTISNSLPAVFISVGSHCSDMGATKTNDPPELTAARITIDQIVNAWIYPQIPESSTGGLTRTQKIIIICVCVGGGLPILLVTLYCCFKRRSGAATDTTDHFAKIPDQSSET